MSATVGPSQRVCSRPTLVSTTTGARSTPVASWRPPRPASTTATSTPRRASSSNAAAVSTSNWVTRSPSSQPAVDLRGRLRGALHGGAERVGLEVARRRSGCARRSDVRCGERNAPVRTPCASSSAAVMRTVELLPFVPTTWIAPKRSCGEPSAVSSRRIRSRPKRMPNSSRPSRCSSARAPASRRAPVDVTARRAPRAAARACRARPRRPPSGALATKPSLASLLLRARDLGVEPAAALARSGARRRRGRRASDAQHRDRAAGHRDASRPARRRPATTRSAPAARRASRRALVALGLQPRRQHARPGAAPIRSRQPRSACTAAIARADLRLGVRVDQRLVGGRPAAPISRPSAPGTCDQISSVTNGITGCAIASVSAQHAEREAR